MRKKINLPILILTVIVMVAMAVGLYMGLGQLFKTEYYYILNQSVGSKQKVTAEMLSPVEVSEGGSPQNALTLAQVESGDIYTRIPLYAGDILTESNTSLNMDTTGGIPDDWLITSFNTSTSKAVGGRIQRGDYIDIIGIAPAGAKYIAVDVLVLDANYSTMATGEEQQEIMIDDVVQFIVGAPPQEIAVLTHATDGDFFESIRVFLSPKSVQYKERNLEEMEGVFLADMETPLFDLYQGTDNSFAPVLRDDNGRPVTRQACDDGKIVPVELCEKISDKQSGDREHADADLDNDLSHDPKDLEPTGPAETELEPEETLDTTPPEDLEPPDGTEDIDTDDTIDDPEGDAEDPDSPTFNLPAPGGSEADSREE